MESPRCNTCGTPHPTYYSDGKCFSCVNIKVGKWRDSMLILGGGEPYVDDSDHLHTEIPLNPNVAKNLGLEYYYTGKACKVGKHPRKEPVDGRRRCLNCVNPRADARRDKAKTYHPATPCEVCQTSERRTQDNECIQCLKSALDGRVTASGQFQRANPDLILTKDGARMIGLKVYRTGRPCFRGHEGYRYLSTGTCIQCVKGGS